MSPITAYNIVLEMRDASYGNREYVVPEEASSVAWYLEVLASSSLSDLQENADDCPPEVEAAVMAAATWHDAVRAMCACIDL